MNIGEIMTSNPVFVNQEDSMPEAANVHGEKGCKHLPATNGGEGNPVGIITDRELKRASASNATALDNE